MIQMFILFAINQVLKYIVVI